MTSGAEGKYMNISGAASSGNNGQFLITHYVSSSSVVISNPLAVAGDANNGAITWVESQFGQNIGSMFYFSVEGEQVEAVVTDWSTTVIYSALPGTADVGEGYLYIVPQGATQEKVIGAFSLTAGVNLPQGPIYIAGQTWLISRVAGKYATQQTLARGQVAQMSRGQFEEAITLGPRGRSSVEFITQLQSNRFTPQFSSAEIFNQDTYSIGKVTTATLGVLGEIPQPPNVIPVVSLGLSPTTGESTTASGTVTGTGPQPTGTVALYIDANLTPSATTTLVSGAYSVLLPGSAFVTDVAHTVTAIYEGNTYYVAASSPPETFTYTGAVEAPIVAGSSLSSTAKAHYAGRSTIVASSSVSATASASLITPSLAITASPASPPGVSTIGVTISINMTVSGSGPTPTGTVTLYYGLTSGWSGDAAVVPGGSGLPLSSGVYDYTFSSSTIGVGDYTVGFSYSGDAAYNPVVFTAGPTATVHVYSDVPSLGITASPPGPNAIISHLGDTLTMIGTVSGGGPTPTGTVTFLYGTQSGWPGSGTGFGFTPFPSGNNVALSGGSYTFVVNTASYVADFGINNYNIGFSYSGDSNYSSETYFFGTPATLEVYSEVVSFSAFNASPSSWTPYDGSTSNLTIKVNGAGGGAPTPTGTIQFWVYARGSWSQLGGLYGSSGNVASVSSPHATLTGLVDCYPALVGQSLTISSATNPGNEGTFVITSYISSTSVIISNPSAVVELTGDVAWTIPAPTPSATISGGVAVVTGIVGHAVIPFGDGGSEVIYLAAQYSGDANYSATAAPSGGPPPSGAVPYTTVTSV